MDQGKGWRAYPKIRPCAEGANTYRSGLCWITVEYTEGRRKGERFVSIAALTNIDYPGWETLWEYWIKDNPHCNLVDHYGSGRKVIAWKPFEIPEPYSAG